MVKAYKQEHIYKNPWERVTSASWCSFTQLVIYTSVVDAKSRSMQLTSRNISLQKFIEVEEKTRYDLHPDNPTGRTICKQETQIRIKPLSELASMAEKVEQRCADRFLQNTAKSRSRSYGEDL
ncbi:PRELI/MSF1 domain [Sesbania bispinosa]|nr:PRELI/MSF1 domain [Sesbania bispinosa]